MPDPSLQRSPLASRILEPSKARGAGVVLQESAFRGHINLRGDLGNPNFSRVVEAVLGTALPVQPNTVARARHALAAWLGPDEWLLISSSEESDPLIRNLQQGLVNVFCAINDLSGGQTIIEISGPRALDVLAKGCTLDLHPRTFGPGACAQSHVAKASALIIPRASNLPCYDVVVRRSFADYLWGWLVNAAREYAVRTL